MVSEIHDKEHEIIKEKFTDIYQRNEEHETRLTLLEKISAIREEQIKHILEGMYRTNKAIESLVGWIKWGLAFLVPSSIAFAVWLLQQQLVQ